MLATEAQIQQAIMAYLQLRGLLVYRMNAGAIKTEKGHLVRLSPVGTPDLLCLLVGGGCLWIEVKTEKGKLTEYQEQAHERLRGLGHQVFVAHSVSEVEGYLDGADWLSFKKDNFTGEEV